MVKHEGTKVTKTHEGAWYELNDYRQPRLSGRWLGLLINFNTDLLERGLRRVLDG